LRKKLYSQPMIHVKIKEALLSVEKRERLEDSNRKSAVYFRELAERA